MGSKHFYVDSDDDLEDRNEQEENKYGLPIKDDEDFYELKHRIIVTGA